MINNLQLLRCVGVFDQVATGAHIPLARLSIIYAENGRGKTTLAAILRSLSTGDPLPILERRRLAATNPPQVVVRFAGGSGTAAFVNGVWNFTLPNLLVFDDRFIDENFHSGLAVDADHRQHLHDFVLGTQGVTLSKQLQELINRVEAHNSVLRTHANNIPVGLRGPFTVDEFCSLALNAEIDGEIQEAQRRLAAIREQEPIRQHSSFAAPTLPPLDIEEIIRILNLDLPALDTAAATRVQAHLASLGRGGESWVADGMERIPPPNNGNDKELCPFCAQDLMESPVIQHYRAYFSDAYAELKRSITETLDTVNRDHGEQAQTGFERAVRISIETREFWARFTDIPDIRLDTETIVKHWQILRTEVVHQLRAKQAAPLEPREMRPEVRAAAAVYERHRESVAALAENLRAANLRISAVKANAAAGDLRQLQGELTRLTAVKERQTPETSALCNAYLREQGAKAQTEQARDQARAALEQYRANAFPAIEAGVNDYLARFNAGFRIQNMAPVNNRGGSACNYNLVINTVAVSIGGGTPVQGEPSFRNTLSAGDRNTLTLAFFFASLDRDQNLVDRIIVIDDPMSSLDQHRALTTIQEIRRLATRAAQVILLSHSKPFLCELWEGAERIDRAAIRVVRDQNGSTLEVWNVDADSVTDHDRNHELLRGYLQNGATDLRPVAAAIRPILEAYMRVSYPEHYQPGMTLGVFSNLCAQRIGTQEEMLSAADIRQLDEITEYANRFHHDTNAAYATQVINDIELEGYVRRAIRFTRRL